MKPIFFPKLAIPMVPKTRSEKFRAWLEKWLPVRFGPRYWQYEANCDMLMGSKLRNQLGLDDAVVVKAEVELCGSILNPGYNTHVCVAPKGHAEDAHNFWPMVRLESTENVLHFPEESESKA